MPEENFIYWDDVEWGYRFNQVGYKVAAYGKAKVWHKGGARTGGTTFNHYYLWRNRIKFFLKVLPQEKKEHFADVILGDMFRMIYSCNLKGDYGVIKTVMYAFDDAVHGITGRAPDYKIFQRTTNGNRVEMALKDAQSVIILYNDDMVGLGNIIRNIQGIAADIKIAISFEGCETKPDVLESQYPDCEICETYEPQRYDRHLVMCEHIFKMTEDMPQDNYIDAWCNIIFSKKDFVYVSSFEQTKDLFVMCKKELLLHSCLREVK
jgi:hypothetical protein